MDGGVGGGDDGVKEGKKWARRGGEVLCEQGLEMARRIGKGVGYLECDAREGGVGEKILDWVSFIWVVFLGEGLMLGGRLLRLLGGRGEEGGRRR